MRPITAEDDLATKHGAYNLSFVAPHGIIGQSFDGSQLAVTGKQDQYTDAPEFTTSAQAEGAIEGNYTQYMLAAPFATTFAYDRFGATTHVAPRDAKALSGFKVAVKTTSLAASTELVEGAEQAGATVEDA